MRKKYLAGCLLIFLIVAVVVALFVPSYLAKREIDRLAASLPAGAKFTYDDASYSLFSRALVLQGGVLHIADPAVDVDFARMRIKGGNLALDRAIAEARATPVSDKEGTRIASEIVLENVHTVYGPLDVKTASIDITDARLYLNELLTPLPPLKSTPSVLDTVENGVALQGVLQSIARADLALAYDKARFDQTNMLASDHAAGQTVTAHIGSLESNGYDRGNFQAGTLEDFSLEANQGSLDIAALRAGASHQRGFLTALLEGEPLEVAIRYYSGMGQTVDRITLKGKDATLAAIEQVTLGSVVYQDGIPVSLDLDIKALVINAAAMPGLVPASVLTALGYGSATFNATLSYKWDIAARQITIFKSSIVLEHGGRISVDGAFTSIEPSNLQAAKVTGLTVEYVDNALAGRWLDYVARQTSQSVSAVKGSYIRWLQDQKSNFKGDAPLTAAIDALAAFVNNPHVLTLGVKPAVPIGLSDFDRALPETFSSKLGLTVVAHQ